MIIREKEERGIYYYIFSGWHDNHHKDDEREERREREKEIVSDHIETRIDFIIISQPQPHSLLIIIVSYYYT